MEQLNNQGALAASIGKKELVVVHLDNNDVVLFGDGGVIYSREADEKGEHPLHVAINLKNNLGLSYTEYQLATPEGLEWGWGDLLRMLPFGDMAIKKGYRIEGDAEDGFYWENSSNQSASENFPSNIEAMEDAVRDSLDPKLGETGNEDFYIHLDLTCEVMHQEDAVGKVYGFKRELTELVMQIIPPEKITVNHLKQFEIVIFDGGNKHGDRWKRVYYMLEKVNHFVKEES